jgi:hypothetical protein
MTKYLLLIILFFSYDALAQMDVSIGINGGYLFPINKSKSSSIQPKTAYTVGLDCIVSVSKHFDIIHSLGYTSFNMESSYNNYYDFFTNSYITTPTIGNYTANYVSSPLALRYNFMKRKIRPYIQVGLTPYVKVSEKRTYNNDIVLDDGSYATAANAIISTSLGAGVNYKISEHLYCKLLMVFNYQLTGIYPINQGASVVNKLKYNSVETNISMGYTF